MSLYLEIKSTKRIAQNQINELLEQNLDFFNFLTNPEDKKFALNTICKYIKKDCDEAFIVKENNQVAGMLFVSYKYSKKNIVKDKRKINDANDLDSKNLFRLLMNIRNLANIYKLELNERHEKYVFIDYLFINSKFNVEEVKNFLYNSFINNMIYSGYETYYLMNINNNFQDFIKQQTWHVVDQQHCIYLPHNVAVNIQLIQTRLLSRLEEEKIKLDNCYTNIFGHWINLSYIYHKSYPAYDENCQERILLIHGVASSHGTWDNLIPLLRYIANIEVIDLPIHGNSNNSAYNTLRWDIFSLSLFVKAFIKWKNWDSLILWGHSLGGGVSISVKQLIPERIKALILEDPYNSGALEVTLRYILTSSKTMRLAKKEIGKSTGFSKAKWTNAIQTYKPLTKNTIFFLWSLFSKQIMNYLDWAYYNNTTPTLVCFGRDDIVINTDLSKKFFKNLNNNYVFKEIKTAGHSVHHDNPKDLMVEVLNFLKDKLNINVDKPLNLIDTIKK